GSRGQSIRDLPQAYPNLRIATRDRDKLVRMRTAVSNRIHSYVDRLFPGFLSVSKSGVEPFSSPMRTERERILRPHRCSHRAWDYPEGDARASTQPSKLAGATRCTSWIYHAALALALDFQP